MQRPLYERPMHVPPQYDPLRPHIVDPEGYYRLPSRQHERPSMLLSNSVPGSLYVPQRPVGPVGYIEHEILPHERYAPIPTYERSVHDYYGTNPILSGNNRRKQKEPDSFDGKCSEWVDYIIHFEQVASWNQWTDREKAQQLTMCLRGYAQKILSDLTLGQMSDYNALKNVLSQRFNPREGEVAYRCEFRNRRRQNDETVAEYGYGLRRLAQQAYPTIRYHKIEPTALSQATAFASEYEAFLGPVDKIVKPRETFDAHNIQTLQALTESEQQNSESKILGQISQMIDNKFKEYLNENRTVDTSRNRIGSYNEPNRNEGQARSDFENRPKQIETFKKQVQFADVVNEATTLDQRVNKISCQDREPLCRQEVDTCINVESTTPIVHLNQFSGSCLYVKAEINSTQCKLLVDTGSPVCVISSKLFNTMDVDKTELQKTDTALYTADGTKLVVKGQVNVQVKLGTEIFKQNVIVANIEELAGILGMDYLETQDVEIQIGKRVLKIKGKNVPLEKSKSSICARVKLSNDVTIPAHSEMLIESHIDGRTEGEMGLIEGTNFIKNKGLLLAKSLIDSKTPKQRLYMLNVNQRSVKLNKNTTIGIVNKVDMVSNIGLDIKEPDESLKSHTVPEHLKPLFDSASENLTNPERNKLKSLMIEFQDIFGAPGKPLGQTNTAMHSIDTGNHPPIKLPPRRLSLAQKEIVDNELEKMLKDKVIQPSTSSYSAPICLVLKKDKTWRFCSDFRKINSCTLKDVYPLPKIDSTFEALSGLRWFHTLDLQSGYWQYRPGSKHVNADAMSRHPRFKCTNESCVDCVVKSQIPSNETSKFDRICPISVAENTESPKRAEPNWLPIWETDTLEEMQSKDRTIGPIRQLRLEFDEKPPKRQIQHLDGDAKMLWTQWPSLEIVDGLLYRQIENKIGQNILQLVAPKVIRDRIFKELYENRIAGHFGRDRTLSSIRRRFYWPGMSDAVKRWCASCDLCARVKLGPGLGRAALRQFEITMPLECVAIDICGPFPVTRDSNEYIIVIGDYFTKWKEAYAVQNHTALVVADKIVTEFFCRFGCPIQIHSDQGREFESDLFEGICYRLGIDKSRTTPYRPQSDGLIERFNRTLKQLLRMFSHENPTDWDDHLPYVLMAYRATEQNSTKCTPNLLMLGREIWCPIDLMAGPPPDRANVACPIQYVEWVKEAMSCAFEFTQREFDIGDWVWRWYPPTAKLKLGLGWTGPYLVFRKISPITLTIQKAPNSRVVNVHVDHLKLYMGNDAPRNWLHESDLSKISDILVERPNDVCITELQLEPGEPDSFDNLNLPGPSNAESTPRRHVTRTGRILKPRDIYSPSPIK
ncbi:unnamed protein product [Mytilus coruscus]|uniref:Integrase catalytic domain-containing protein n=1 Tax=Mytilus coruscus TaxID=42192 RepID=A0A6J8AGF4_MYTCO|nr:unnamed protein product [Mytilus coruscus]